MKRKAGVVDICGLPFTVYLADEKGCATLAECYGACFPDKQEIYLSAAMPRAMRRLYLEHEGMHAVWAHTGTGDLLKTSPLASVEEPFVRSWAAPMLRFHETSRRVRL